MCPRCSTTQCGSTGHPTSPTGCCSTRSRQPGSADARWRPVRSSTATVPWSARQPRRATSRRHVIVSVYNQSMARTEDDSWDITESVGATALGVAGGRAAETESENPLISDPYARMFLDAVGGGMPDLYARVEDLPPELTAVDPRMPERMEAMRGYLACRTLFFDEFFLAAASDGVRQVVILAAGLDARAWRLDWPAGAIVYELDLPKVLGFKGTTLQTHGVQPRATYVGVPVDLRHDWPAALCAAGFDPALPTAWS